MGPNLNGDVFGVGVVDPVLTEVRDLLVEGLLEQRPAFSEGSNGTDGSTTPEHRVGQETLDGVGVDVLEERQDLVGRSLNVLKVSKDWKRTSS